jgi:hypothetical protein
MGLGYATGPQFPKFPCKRIPDVGTPAGSLKAMIKQRRTKAATQAWQRITRIDNPISGCRITNTYITIGIYHALYKYYVTRRKVISKFDNITLYSMEISILI